MRTLTRITLALAASALSFGVAQAQTISNLDLETWRTRTSSVSAGVLAPDNFLTDDDLFSDGSFSFGTLTRTTDKHAGTYAAKISNDNSGDPSFFALGRTIGNADADIPGGLPFTARPVNFSFYYKLTGSSAVADEPLVAMQLTRTVNGTVEVIGEVVETLTSTSSSYSLASFPVDYSSTATPDTVRILFISGTTDVTPSTAIFIDDINLGTTTATRNAATQAAVTVSPNPSAGGRFALNTTEAALLNAPITVTDVAGRVVLREAAVRPATERTVDLSRQPAGIYTLQLQTEKGLVVHKLVVQ